MSEQLLECPKDPEMKYLKTVCEKIFRQNDYRVWCKTCQYFDPPASESEMTAK